MGKCRFCLKSAGWFSDAHKECEIKHKEGKKDIAQRSLAFFDTSSNVEIEELEQMADNNFISYGEFEDIMERTYSNKLEEYLDDGLLNDAEENILFEYKRHFKLTQEQLNKNDGLGKTIRASILRSLLNGEELTTRMNITGTLPFKFQKSESMVWLFKNVELFEQRIKTEYVGGSHGVSMRIAKGLYYRTSTFKGRPVKSMNIVSIANGMVALTNKHIYFASEVKNFRIRYDRIISLQSYSDGIGITKDGVTAKPQVFKNIDGWFCYNFIQNIESN